MNVSVVPYLKPWRSLPEQYMLLLDRGMSIENRNQAEHKLATIGYYRLSGYWYQDRVRLPVPTTDPRSYAPQIIADNFVVGTSFARTHDLYEFDRVLKLAVLDAVERVEIAIRFQVGHVLGRRDPFAHYDPVHLDRAFSVRKPGKSQSTYEFWMSKLERAQRDSREEFVSHFAKYGGKMPAWVMTEILDFGALSYLFSGLKAADRNEIALNLGVIDSHGGGHGKMLANWLQVVNFIRNTCAHHARLWNRNMTVQLTNQLKSIPELRHVADSPDGIKRVYGSLCVLIFLTRHIESTSTWATTIGGHVVRNLPPTGHSLVEMGFPPGWVTEPIWELES